MEPGTLRQWSSARVQNKQLAKNLPNRLESASAFSRRIWVEHWCERSLNGCSAVSYLLHAKERYGKLATCEPPERNVIDGLEQTEISFWVSAGTPETYYAFVLKFGTRWKRVFCGDSNIFLNGRAKRGLGQLSIVMLIEIYSALGSLQRVDVAVLSTFLRCTFQSRHRRRRQHVYQKHRQLCPHPHCAKTQEQNQHQQWTTVKA
jgi:hypothetical protein